MGVRPPFDRDIKARVDERVDKLISRSYLLWLVGLLVGALEIKPQKYSGFGLELTLKSPDLLQGFFFVAVFLCYVFAIGWTIIYSNWTYTTSRGIFRKAIFTALGSKKTLLARTSSSIKAVKQLAKSLVRVRLWFLVVVVFLPAIHILVFHRSALWSALKSVL